MGTLSSIYQHGPFDFWFPLFLFLIFSRKYSYIHLNVICLYDPTWDSICNLYTCNFEIINLLVAYTGCSHVNVSILIPVLLSYKSTIYHLVFVNNYPKS